MEVSNIAAPATTAGRFRISANSFFWAQTQSHQVIVRYHTIPFYMPFLRCHTTATTGTWNEQAFYLVFTSLNFCPSGNFYHSIRF